MVYVMTRYTGTGSGREVYPGWCIGRGVGRVVYSPGKGGGALCAEYCLRLKGEEHSAQSTASGLRKRGELCAEYCLRLKRGELCAEYCLRLNETKLSKLSKRLFLLITCQNCQNGSFSLTCLGAKLLGSQRLRLPVCYPIFHVVLGLSHS